MIFRNAASNAVYVWSQIPYAFLHLEKGSTPQACPLLPEAPRVPRLPYGWVMAFMIPAGKLETPLIGCWKNSACYTMAPAEEL